MELVGELPRGKGNKHNHANGGYSSEHSVVQKQTSTICSRSLLSQGELLDTDAFVFIHSRLVNSGHTFSYLSMCFRLSVDNFL